MHIILNQACKFTITRKNDAFVAIIANMRLTKIFVDTFALTERLPTSATLLVLKVKVTMVTWLGTFSIAATTKIILVQVQRKSAKLFCRICLQGYIARSKHSPFESLQWQIKMFSRLSWTWWVSGYHSGWSTSSQGTSSNTTHLHQRLSDCWFSAFFQLLCVNKSPQELFEY